MAIRHEGNPEEYKVEEDVLLKNPSHYKNCPVTGRNNAQPQSRRDLLVLS